MQVSRKALLKASLIPVRLSEQEINTFLTPRLFKSLKMLNHCLADSVSPTQKPSFSLIPSKLTPRII